MIPASINTQELKKRALTASLGVTLLLVLLIWGGGLGAVIISGVLSVLMLYEFCDITLVLNDAKEKRFTLMGIAWLLAVINFWTVGGEFALLVFSFFVLTLFFLFTADRHKNDDLKTHFQELMFSLFGLVYLAFFPTFLVSLRQSANGVHWSLLFFLLIWTNDIGAYFSGHRFGKRKLYPHISPGKTWEGAWGGALLTLVIALLYKVLFFHDLSVVGAIFVALILSVIAPIGDLTESFLKRAFNKKDSGTLLPGHGGFLDRFDSVVLSLPVMYALSRIL